MNDKLGFGFLRLPRANTSDENSVDFERSRALADHFIELGGNYFDTAYTYQRGNSERAIYEAVIKHRPRESVRIADKLPPWKLRSCEDCARIFSEQLERCGVEYFDVYLLHGLDQKNYETCLRFGAFEFVEEMRASGRVKKTGVSFHDSPELLDAILTAHPELDYVQLQINYLDWESEAIQSRRCYEIAVKHRKRVIVMEPVKGGSLASLPKEAEALLRAHAPNQSMASWALRFAKSLENVEIVLSGMNDEIQIEDNMRASLPLSQAERKLLTRAAELIRSATAVGCTGCGYCLSGCPQFVPIPSLLALYNEYVRTPEELWKMEYRYRQLAQDRASASDCVACGACESRCPQRLKIIETLKKVGGVFEKE